MKKGISLIVLVITIIVMIILAASVIISLNNTGVIDKASQAVKVTDEKQVQDLAALAWAEAYLDENRVDPIEDVVKEKLENQGVVLTDWNIEVSNTGVTITSKSSVALITFSYIGVEYQAEEGMTWREWINSKYNKGYAEGSGYGWGKFFIVGDFVNVAGDTIDESVFFEDPHVDFDADLVYADDIIISGHKYYS